MRLGKGYVSRSQYSYASICFHVPKDTRNLGAWRLFKTGEDETKTAKHMSYVLNSQIR